MTCGSGSFIDRVVPDKPFGLVDFTEACRWHDQMYKAGKALTNETRWNRKTVDKVFQRKMLNAADVAARWYKPRWLLRSLAHTYYGFVRLFGGSAWRKAHKP